MIETLRPKLSPSVRTRTRSDGTVGVYDPGTSNALEVSPDQAPLLALIDGVRTVPEIAAEHLGVHGFVPFGALRDLLRSLAAAGLLANPHAELAQEGLVAPRRWMQRLGARVVAGFPLPGGLAAAMVLALALAGLAGWSQGLEREDLEPIDVLLFTAGAALALASRGIFKAAAAALFGAPPVRAYVGLAGWVVFPTIDHAVAVLLDRRPRGIAYVAALAGSFVAMLAGAPRPGLWAGALAVLLIDLCPFAPTSMGRLLATIAGKVDLREHVRAYIARRFLKRVASARFFAGEGNLIFSALLSLAWISLIVRLLLTDGVIGVLSLVAAGLDADEPYARWLAYGGAAGLALCIPVALGLLVAAVARAVLSLRPAAAPTVGEKTGAGVQAADFAAIPFFSRLGAGELAALVQAAKELKYRSGGPIVVQGAAGESFFAIRSGEVAVEREDDSGLVRELARLGPGDCFGETALLEGTVRTATVRPLRDTVVAELSRADFDRVRQGFAGTDISALLRSTAALGKSRFFGQLAADRLSALAMRLTPRQVTAGAEVVRQGDRGDEFFLVGAGTLEVLDAAGARTAQLGAGDHFGEIALLRDVPRTATVRAVTDATLMVLAKPAFIEGIAHDLKLGSRLEELAAERAETVRR